MTSTTETTVSRPGVVDTKRAKRRGASTRGVKMWSGRGLSRNNSSSIHRSVSRRGAPGPGAPSGASVVSCTGDEVGVAVSGADMGPMILTDAVQRGMAPLLP